MGSLFQLSLSHIPKEATSLLSPKLNEPRAALETEPFHARLLRLSFVLKLRISLLQQKKWPMSHRELHGMGTHTGGTSVGTNKSSN